MTAERRAPRRACRPGSTPGGDPGDRKKPGTNAVELVTELDGLMARCAGRSSGNIEVTKTRDYGATADEKSSELMKHLGLARSRSSC